MCNSNVYFGSFRPHFHLIFVLVFSLLFLDLISIECYKSYNKQQKETICVWVFNKTLIKFKTRASNMLETFRELMSSKRKAN